MSSFYSIPGPAGTIQIGTVSTGAEGTNAAVTNTGTAESAILNFQIPRGNTGAVSAAGDGTAALPGITFADDINTGIYRPGADQVAISTGGAGRLFVDASGNVGVGTSSTAGLGAIYRTLTIRGHDPDYGGGIVFESSDASDRTFVYGDSGAFYAITQDARPLILGTNGTERLRITSAGLVGVGTSVPDSAITIKQDISSATAITAANSQVGISSGSGSGANFRSTLYFNPLNSSGNGSPAAISAIASGNTNSSLAFYTNGSSNYTGTPVERLRIDDQGRVGIGASSPSYNLQVAETSAVVSAASYSTFFGQGTRADLVLQATSSNNDQQRQVIRSNSDSLIFGTENAAVTTFTEKLRITSAGHVGVGTSIPGDQLDVAAGNYRGATIKCGTTGHRPTLSFLNTADSLAAYIQAVGNSLTFGAMATDYGGHSPRMTLTSTGLGIGTSSPGTNLHVGSGAGGNGLGLLLSRGATSNFFEAHDGTKNFIAGTDSSNAFVKVGSLTNNPVAIVQSNVEAIYIDTSKRVGIGTTSPSTILSIGAFASSSLNGGVCLNRGPSAYNFYEASDGTNSVVFGLDNSLSVAKIGSANSYPIGFFTGNAERARIDSSGRLLVGTSSARNAGITGSAPLLQVESASTPSASIIRTAADAFAPAFVLGKIRSTSIVSSGDELGVIAFEGYDGSTQKAAASIAVAVDGTPGANDMPGRIVLSTTADGASSPTERMRIKSNGTINFSNVAVYADNAAATTGGLAVGDVYRTSTGQLMIRY